MRILLIDDESDILTSVKKVLTRLGHVCDTFTDAEEAVRHYLDDPYDVVITDCKMPSMHGNDVLKEIRTQRPLANVVMMTAYSETDSAIEALNLGAAAYLKKPLDYNQLLGVLADIEGKRRESYQSDQERNLLEKELRRTQHLGSLGLMAGGIAHDFNNLLASILGYSELLLLDSPDDPRVVDNVQMIHTAAEHARELVRQILRFSRSEEAQPVDLHLKPLIGETLSLLQPSIPLNIHVLRSLDPMTGMVKADPASITQVLINLCLNAIHAMELNEYGELAVGLENCLLSESDARELGLRLGGPHVRFWVSDNGSGIDPSIRSMIFKPFFTTKEPGKGTGLGLHMVQRIINAVDGAVAVDSIPGSGSRFTVYLPRNACITAERFAPNTQLQPGFGNLLVVDDQPEVAQLVSRMLSRLGYSVFEKTDSLAALDFFELSFNDIDAAVLNLNMPGLGGLRLAAELRRIKPGLPLLIISGAACPDPTDPAMIALGDFTFLQKPLGIRELSRCLHEMLLKSPENP
jgi:signal transduction histidine kinase